MVGQKVEIAGNWRIPTENHISQGRITYAAFLADFCSYPIGSARFV